MSSWCNLSREFNFCSLMYYWFFSVLFDLYDALTNNKNYKKVVVQKQLIPQNPLVGISTRNDVFNDPYAPPLKDDGMYFRRDSSDIRGHPPIQVPVNI